MSAVEFVLLLKTQQVCLFQIPPLTTSKGYYLDDWKQMFWEGGCKLTEKAGLLTLYFIDKNTQAIQTLVQMPDNPYDAIQKTIDSSRGYAVRLVTPNGSFQWVGCVFRDRNDAFDFNAKITDFIERREMERNPTKFKNEFQPTQDFSLKQGEKLQINLSIDGQAKKQTTEKSGQSNLSDFTFAPPPDFNDFAQFSAPVQKNTTQQATNEFSGWSDWGQQQQKPQQSQTSFQQPFQQAFQQQQQQQQQQPFQQVQQQQQVSSSKNKSEVNLLDL